MQLTHLGLAYNKMNIGKQCRATSEPQNAASDQDLHCLQ